MKWRVVQNWDKDIGILSFDIRLLDSLVALLIRRAATVPSTAFAWATKGGRFLQEDPGLGQGTWIEEQSMGKISTPSDQLPLTETSYFYPVTTVTAIHGGPVNWALLNSLYNWDSCERRTGLIKSVVHNDAYSEVYVCVSWWIKINYQRWLEKSKGSHRHED